MIISDLFRLRKKLGCGNDDIIRIIADPVKVLVGYGYPCLRGVKVRLCNQHAAASRIPVGSVIAAVLLHSK